MLRPCDISNKKYLSLETYRKKNIIPVCTPVWFVIYNDLIHIVTRDETGKIKRLRNNPNVRVALCTFNGKVTGPWSSGKIAFSSAEDLQAVLNLRRKKYGFMERVARFASRKKGNFIAFSVRIDKEQKN